MNSLSSKDNEITNLYIGSFRVSNIRSNDIYRAFEQVISTSSTSYVLYANAHTYLLTRSNDWLLALNKDAQLVLADGYGVVWACRLLTKKEPALVTLTYQNDLIAEACIAAQKSIYLLGGMPGIATSAAENLKERHPQLLIAGSRHGYFKQDIYKSTEVIEDIRSSGAQVLVLGLGSPLQERWYLDHSSDLEGVVCIMGGNCLSYWAGIDSKPPDFMTRNGLAWLHRTIQHPIRLLPRYLSVIPRFIIHVLILKLKTR